ncbi:DUF397 domain-containing protein [Nocardiopsis sediminis]|uniref:DUF397 domain-containing protein n=1 Tax=Nocardiopsis sediminis TaxID=1778267 RepID=A0ABV8FM83_9ACTN
MTTWHTSSYSLNGSNCVEVRQAQCGADVRDTFYRDDVTLSFSASEWRAFLTEVDGL